MKGLFIVHTDVDALKKKGVLRKILDRDEGGFLEEVITVHPFGRERTVEMLSSSNIIHELKAPAVMRFRPLSWLLFVVAVLRAVWYTRRIIRISKIDFVRAQDPYLSGLVGYLATRLPRIPFCISLHADYDTQHALSPGTASPTFFGSRALAKKLERFLLRRADRVLAITSYISDVAKRNGAFSERTRIFRHLVDLNLYRGPVDELVLRSMNFESKSLVVSAVCRLSREKHVYDLIELAERLRGAGIAFCMKIGGGGTEEAGLSSRIAAFKLEDHVRLLGPLTAEQVVALRRSSDVCVCLLDGMSLIEALAAGKPVVGYDIEWHREGIIDGVNGFLVPEGNLEMLTNVTAKILEDVCLREKMGLESSRLANLFDQRSGIASHRSIYNDLIESLKL